MCKNKIRKELYHNNYKSYRNLLSTLLKRAKEKYFINFLLSIKQKNNDTPSLITKDERYINGPVSIANTFRNIFTSVAEIVHSKIKFSSKLFKEFLSSETNDSFLITSTNKEEIYKIITSLNSNKSCGPNSIPTKVLQTKYQTILELFATYHSLQEFFQLF